MEMEAVLSGFQPPRKPVMKLKVCLGAVDTMKNTHTLLGYPLLGQSRDLVTEGVNHEFQSVRNI